MKIEKSLVEAAKKFKKIMFSTSFSAEDQLILDFVVKNELPIEVFAIDTGRLPKQTYDLWAASLQKYVVKIKAFYPDAEELGEFVENNGVNAFYESVDLRKKCCEIRKVEPLRRALMGADLWISGVRASHSGSRALMGRFEESSEFGLTKFYPLLEVGDEEMWELIEERGVAVSSLYKRGYLSIGCDPCSRAVLPGEGVRSGRWWWEDEGKRECGIHEKR